MKSSEIKNLFEQLKNALFENERVECWSAYEIYEFLGYTQWRNFTSVIDKAKESCKNTVVGAVDHLADVSKMIQMPKAVAKTHSFT